jgi:hypothetical protein
VGTAASGGTSVEMQVIGSDAAALNANVTCWAPPAPIAVASSRPARASPARSTRACCQQGPALHRHALRHRRCHAGGTYRVRDIGIEIQDGAKFYANGFAVL